MNSRYLPLVAVLLAVAGCDFKETRSGQIVLTAGTAGIPLNGKAGAASLVAGSAEITFKKGSGDRTVAVLVRQMNRADVEFEAKVFGDYTSGNFTLKGSEIGQPVDMASSRAYTITGPTQRYSHWEDQGFQLCLVEVSFDPCDEKWTVGFLSLAGAELGAFSSRLATSCNEQRYISYCRQDPRHDPRYPGYPGYPDYPRPRGMLLEKAAATDPANIKFD